MANKRRGRRTDIRERVPCETLLGGCGALPGQPCRAKTTGRPTSDVHTARWRIYQDSREGMPTEPLKVSVAFQISPLWVPGRPGVAYPGDLKVFADQFCHWVVKPVAGFADMRGGDAFVTVVAQRGDESAAIEYRDGHYHPAAKDKPPIPGAEDTSQSQT